ncbi:hypothetical protein V6N13_109770 [Hibiscus sabdariffa]
MQRQPSTQEVKALDAFCELCGNNHDALECGQNPETSCYIGEYNKNIRSNTYNPEWRKHPNFSWQNQNNSLNPQPSTQQGYQNQPRQLNQPRQDYQQPSNYRTLENTLNTFMTQTSAYMARTDQFIQKTDAFMDRTEMRMQNQEAALKSLKNQVGQISQVLKSRPSGGFPGDTEVAKGATHEHADIPAEVEEDHTDPPATETAAETPQPKNNRTDKLKEIRPPPPFPQRLKKQKHEYQFKKFFEILKQVHINLPLVEALQQMPNYARFLKDMVFRKNIIGEFETAAATETCLAMMHNKVPAKKTDPGSFTKPCSIGHNYSTKALCDPGVSINLMPKSVFQKLGIGEAKPTTVMLQLADHSFIQPEGKIEDILVRVDKFIFPADFLILDCEADEHASIILGRPFLATSRTKIDFEKGELALHVDREQVKIKVFKVQGQKNNEEDNNAITESKEKRPQTSKPYVGAHTERDKTVMFLRDA